jgi:pSer/pThr/pTyr-binding forkhead associated (FHA) protein
MWILKGTIPDGDAVQFRVRPGAIKTIGRSPGAELILEAPLVSRLHCRLEAGDDHVTVVDLESTNGTFINDKRIDQAPIAAGDRLRVGRVEFSIERTSDASTE